MPTLLDLNLTSATQWILILGKFLNHYGTLFSHIRKIIVIVTYRMDLYIYIYLTVIYTYVIDKLINIKYLEYYCI